MDASSPPAAKPYLCGRAPTCVASLLQPIYEIGPRERKIVGAEALARGPRGSSLESPAAMFTAARRLGVVTSLDRECIVSGLTAAMRMPAWVSVFLNVHPATLCHDYEFPAVLAEAAAQAGIARTRITLEVLEYARGSECGCRQVHAALDVLRGSGVRVAVDDVGCESDEIRRAFAYRPDFVKIDGELVRGARRDQRRRALFLALLDRALNSKTAVVAEGISDPADLEFVTEIGIPLAQGFLLCTPLSAGALCDFAGWPDGTLASTL